MFHPPMNKTFNLDEDQTDKEAKKVLKVLALALKRMLKTTRQQTDHNLNRTISVRACR